MNRTIDAGRTYDRASKRLFAVNFLGLEGGNPPFGNITVRDIVDNQIKSKNLWGVEGYNIPNFDKDKSFAVKISTIKKTTYLDDAMRQTKHIPAPW